MIKIFNNYKLTFHHLLFIIYIIGLSLLIWRTHDLTIITLKNKDYSNIIEHHLYLQFFGSILVLIYATYYKIWPLASLNLVSIYQASIFYWKIYHS